MASVVVNLEDVAEAKRRLEKALKTAELGAPMRRVQFRRLGTPSIIKLNGEHSEVYYSSHSSLKCVPKKYKTVKVSEILEVRNGWNTDNFQRMATKSSFTAKVQENCCFSVIFRHRHLLMKSVDLVTESSDFQQAWVIALRHLVAKIKKEALHFNEEQWLKQHFHEADENNNGFLSFKEVYALLSKLNLEISQDHARKIYEEADYKKSSKSEEQGLEFDEFLRFFRFLTKRKDLLKIIREHSTNNVPYFNAQDLKNFIENVQKRPQITLEECVKLIKEFEPDELNRKDTILTVHGFRKFLLSSEYGSIFNQKHKTVFQDMTLPLVNYFINSSHNTYLSGHQLAGDATIEGYIQTLQEGFKFLELDVWDGDKEPTITHGHTLVNPIRFRDVIRAIDQYAFYASPYPVILTLENHCSSAQQSQMASIFKEIFGDKLYVTPASLTDLPSPEALKGKILLKGKTATSVPAMPVINPTTDDLQKEDSDSENEVEVKAVIATGKQQNQHKIPLFAALTELTGLPSCKLKDLVLDLTEHAFNAVPSIEEKKMLKYIKNDFNNLIRYTSRHVVKVYPLGTRFGSSNYNPVPFWNAGIQIVPLNAQTADEASDLNHAMFSLNGKCGYVLKPEALRKGLFDLQDYATRDYQLTIQLTVISAQYLPKPKTALTQSDVIDPFVCVEIFGLPFDQQKRITKVVYNNGFNPVWDETFEINLRCPEFALLRFSVKDYDRFSSNDFIGEYSLPVISLNEGYGSLCLYKPDQPKLTLSHLFVHVKYEKHGDGFSHVNLRTGYAHWSDPTAVLLVKTNLLKRVLIREQKFCDKF